MSNALRTTVLVTALALSPQVSGALGDVPAVPPAVPQAPTQCGESQTRIVSLLDGEVGCKDMLPSSKLEVRVAQGDLSTNAFNDPTSIGGEWQERQRTQNAEKAQSIRAAQEQLFAQMDGKPLSAPPQLTLRDGNTTFWGQVVTGKNSGTGGRADLLVDEGVVAVGASVTMTPYMRSVFGSLGFKIMDNLNGTITFSTTNVDAARALANTEYKGDLQAWSASGSLHWGAAFVRFLHEKGKSRDESNPLATRMTVSSTVSTEEFATFLRTTTTTIKGKTVTLWDAFTRQTLTAGYTVDIGDQTQVKVFTGATRDTNNGTNLVGGVDITYYGGDYRLDGGVHKFTETWGASIGAEYALTGTTSIFFRGNYNPQHGIAPSNVSTIVGIRVSFDGSSNPGRTIRFTIPKAGYPNVAQLVEETLRDPRLQVDPVKLGKIRNIVTETIEKAIDDIQKLPEAVQGARAVVNADNSVTVTFSPRNGWGYESRIDTGTWTPVLGAGFTTAVLPAGAHTIALREKHPTTNVTGHITSLSVNITAPNQNPNPFSAIAPISVTVGTAGSATLPTTTDPNGDTLTYSTVGTLPTGFSFNPTTRVLSWIAGTTAGTYSLTYKADDGKGGSVTSTISLNVSAAPNTPPTAINFTAGALTAGALTAGQSVGNLTCTDPEGQACTYALSSQGTPGAFSVASNGAVTVANTGLTAGTHTITITATDVGGLTRTETKSITVSAAPNTPPTAINFTAGALTAGALTAGQSVGNLTCTDPEGQACTYALSSQGTPGAFSVASNGAVTVANTGLIAGTHTITITATDVGGLTRTETKSITVSAAPVDNTEVVTLPTPTITATAITFSGGSVTDKDNPSGFSPTVSYIVKDTAGNAVSASSLTPNTTYTWQMQYTTYNGATNMLMTKTTSPQNFTTPALADTTAPQLTSSGTLPASNIGASVSHTLTFDEAINTVSVGTTPPGMTVTASKSGNTVTLTISTTAAFTAFGDVNIPLTVTDSATPANSRTVNINKTINDVAPVAGGAFASLTDMTLSDNSGAFHISVNAGGVTDTLGRPITYSATGLPNDADGVLTINPATGEISGIYDALGIGGSLTLFTITVTASNGSQSISRTFILSIRNDG